MSQQTILITGAGSGFGKVIALELARAGHIVYASMRDLGGHSEERVTELRAVADEEKIALRPVELDVRSEESARVAVDLILSREGRIDVVMNNAAMMMHGLTEAFRPEQIAEIIDLNAISWVRVNRAALPAMRRAGRGLLLYIGSGINRLPDPFTGPYAASKAAGDVLAEVMGLEVARYGIETVIVQPGAYTSGTNHFKNAVSPIDAEVVSQYDRLAGLAGELAERLDRTNLPDRRHDVGEVAEAVRDIVAMTPGTRPRRVDIDPQGRNVCRINDVTAELQRDYFRRLGVEDLLQPGVEGAGSSSIR
ncbi:SDR family NAD(P)-dependent oxidoreductase [Paraburkholderia madseniana]|uniref:SDR family NAD(P)-dependent oxidoreductase n=1 Tax=Paraburkholderia madseniana TaxID=2599607 RepID=A0AAP5BHL1_9BURK|nr:MULTISPECIES: SDR family NAD(P)-dependent oxidoreductase [Paraburkholderia]MCX4148862.1 SDR family NAD(P)-dependent oxidoreductase [Paraburkholderia madseniana]MDN7151800.1 SDR family NAD(P)-dependent oxidoreductase [Paraburkholderia sp. WS6]MDQ6410680.1 SDR family NAD(P)-dependent oxidoreductase [Paraburkholderia madseniana]